MASLMSPAAYTYRADLYCPRCITNAVISHRGIPRLGHAVVPPPADPYDTEGKLDAAAGAWGVDRMDERSFDSSAFPKVAFLDQLTPGDRCAGCGDLLREGGSR